MSIPVPLSVRLRTSARDVHITGEVDGLTFGSTSPGGYDTCTVSLHRPLSFMPLEVAQFGRLYVYSPAGIVWEGRMQDPGRTAGSDGEVYDIAAVGGQAHLQDDTVPLIYVDTRVENWEKLPSASGEFAGTTVSSGEDLGGSGADAINLQFPTAPALSTSSACTGNYRGLLNSGQTLAVFDYRWDSGNSVVGYQVRGMVDGTIARTETATTAGGGFSAAVLGGGGIIPSNSVRPIVQYRWSGAASTGASDGSIWASVMEPCVRAVTYNKDGTQQTVYTSADKTILASKVVADLLGRLLADTFDGANATIATTSYQIDQLAYPDGVNPAKVHEDLLLLEQAYTWHVWESNPTNDKFRYEWIAWPTTVRYEADIIDGFSSPASGNTVYNKVRVRYRDSRGRSLSTLRSQVVPALVNAGFERKAFMDLGDEVGSLAAANQAGDGFLAEHKNPVNAGRLTIARPVVDLKAGRMVQPYELRAGNLIRVRGVESYPDSLNASSRDGLTVFKIASTSYNAEDAAVTLELDSYAPSVARALAALRKRPAVRRR